MRKTTLAFLLAAATACGHLDDVDFTRSATVTVPGVPGGGQTGPISGVGSVDLGGRDALQSQGINPNDIDAAHLKTLHVDVQSGASLETWLGSVVLSARAQGLPDVVVAQKQNISSLPAGTRGLDLDVNGGVDLKPYLVGTSPVLVVDATGTPPAEDTTLKLTATITVNVNVSGVLGL